MRHLISGMKFMCNVVYNSDMRNNKTNIQLKLENVTNVSPN